MMLSLPTAAGAPEPLAFPDVDWHAPPAEPTPDLVSALAAAREHWGSDPPCGPPSVRFIRYWPGGGVAWPHICVVDIDDDWQSFDDLCNLLTHEIGHLHGWEHPPIAPLDPSQVGGVMDYGTMDDEGVVPACDRERSRRERLEGQWTDQQSVARGRRGRCARLRRGRSRHAGATCRSAAQATARARLLRSRITWPVAL